MTLSSKPSSPLSGGTPRDWAELLALVLMWGSAFALTRVALDGIDPWWVAALRINLGALLLVLTLAVKRRSLPRDPAAWLWFGWLGLVGNVAPFGLISWGQQHVASSLAGILMAVMPLMLVLLAHYLLPDEPLSRRRFAGFALGFVGVVCLMGPLALGGLGFGGIRLWAELAVLAAALGYALNGVTARLAPPMPGIVLATGVMLAAALQSLLLAAWLAPPPVLPGRDALLAIVVLGIFPTAFGAALLYPLISRAGAGFVAVSNYLVPVCALVVGLVFMHESLAPGDYLGLALILAGIALSERGGE
ncbi:MAG: DMT family transporter [Gammaproteobacteria bacterium]